MSDKKNPGKNHSAPATGYDAMLSGVVELLEQARRTSARAVNTIMTATYWEIGRRIVEFEQGGEARAEYGTVLINRVSQDLSTLFGRGFSKRNVEQMRLFSSLGQLRRFRLRNFKVCRRCLQNQMPEFRHCMDNCL